MEEGRTWEGLARLRGGDPSGAVVALRLATESAEAGGRVAWLAAAAVYRSEAAWQIGSEDEADAAADLALEAARRQGSNWQILEALGEFPAVLSRRLDRERDPGSPWHGLGRALRAQRMMPGDGCAPEGGEGQEGQEGQDPFLAELGRLQLFVTGAEVKPRIRKSYELLAYLATAPGRCAGRREVLWALFDGRDDRSTAAYLRQAVAQLRRVWSDAVVVGPVARAGRGDRTLALSPGAGLVAESVRMEALMADGARRQGDDRLDTLIRALRLADAGEYLPGVGTHWAEMRRVHLAARASETRFAVAELLFRRSRYEEAERLAAAVVAVDPYAESAWRLLLRTAAALGDEDRLSSVYGRCCQALSALDAVPSAPTQRLFQALRPA